jgi:predicted nucleic acid-binding Zn ribbon protein
MERAARLIRKSKFSKEVLTDSDLVRAIWPAAVGKAISSHTSHLRLVRNKLVVEVEDALWQRQLFPLTQQILDRIRKVSGSDLVQDVEFRIAIPRREPMREMSSRESSDEAEGIQDPVLKKVYQLARKKATA